MSADKVRDNLHMISLVIVLGTAVILSIAEDLRAQQLADYDPMFAPYRTASLEFCAGAPSCARQLDPLDANGNLVR